MFNEAWGSALVKMQGARKGTGSLNVSKYQKFCQLERQSKYRQIYEKEGIGGHSAKCIKSHENLINDKDTQNERRGTKIWQMP